MYRCCGMMVLFTSLLLLTACQGGSSAAPAPGGGRTKSPARLESGVWPFWPVAMRVHPLTRLVKAPETGEFQIETRVEFTDRDAATSRCSGAMMIALLARSDASPQPIQKEWRIELDDPGINSLHFDEVTRTYLFKLALDSDAPLVQGSLTARFDSADGSRFSAQYELVTD